MEQLANPEGLGVPPSGALALRRARFPSIALALRRARFPAEAQFVHRAKFARQGTVFQSPVTGHYSKEGEDFLPDVNLSLYTMN